jgi:hypothetical protein
MRPAVLPLVLAISFLTPLASAATTQQGDFITAFPVQGVLVVQAPDGSIQVGSASPVDCATGGLCTQPFVRPAPGTQANGVWHFTLLPMPWGATPSCAGPVCSSELPAERDLYLIVSLAGNFRGNLQHCGPLVPVTWTYDFDADVLTGACAA